jgi:Sulfotransferase domain
MLPGFDRRWILRMTNAFLIRDPLLVLASYARKWESVALRDIGILEQWEIFKLIADELGSVPVVIDAEDVLADPSYALRCFCDALGIGFSERMLSWPAGPKSFDGLWGRHWYNAVHASTGFMQPPAPHQGSLPADLQRLADEAAPVYLKLRAHRLCLGVNGTS